MKSNGPEYYTIQPPAQLAGFVQFYWVLNGKASTHEPFKHRVLADCLTELIFYYQGSFNRYTNELQSEKIVNSRIYGQTQQFSTFETTTDFSIFGVCLFPYAVAQLFSLPSYELSDQSVDLKTLLGKSGEILEEKMLLATDNIQRAGVVSDFLINRLKNIQTNYLPIAHSIKNIMAVPESSSINLMAENCFLSRRQFERKFKEFSGFSPKLFLNIARFNAVLKESPRSGSLAQIAHKHGYYDQSHFTHEFNKFSGYTPKEYFKNIPDSTDYRAAIEFKE